MSFGMTVGGGGNGGGDREKCPAGSKLAVLVGVIQLGTQHEVFQGEEKWQKKLYLVWELPTTKTKSGTNHVIATKVTESLNEKANLLKWLEAMLGKKLVAGTRLEWSDLLGKPCILNVQHAGAKGYPKVAGVGGVPEGLPTVPGLLAPFVCSLDEFKAGKAIPEWVPWAWCDALGAMASISEHIKFCKEIAGDGTKPFKSPLSAPGAAVSSGADDPIPF